MSSSALINTMVASARKAARSLVHDFGEVENLQVSRKGPADFVSNADRKAEDILYNELRKARPDFSFLMEERGYEKGRDTSNCWIVDPLDGTTNFLHGIPHFAISIALERDNGIFAGVIYQPVNNELFWAEKGQGAFLNNQRLRVSARREFADSLFATGIPFKGRRCHPSYLEQIGDVTMASSGVRRFGTASLDLAWLAAGRYDGFWETALKPWDMAAGIVLVREAGGFVTDLQGHQTMLQSGDIVAANTFLYPLLLDVLKKADRHHK